MSNIRSGWILAWVVAGLQVLAAGQEQPAPVQPVENASDSGERTAPAAAVSNLAGLDTGIGYEDSSKTLPQIPGVLGGLGISPAFLAELERKNYLRAGVNVGAAYDDNPLLLSSGAAGNTSVSIFPNLSIEESSSRLRWALGYAGGLTVNQRFTNQNQGSHSLIFDSQYRLSPHVNLRVAENFYLTTGFFDSGNVGGVTGSGGPNGSLLTPLATERSSTTTVEANYHVALNDLVGASGSFYDLHFTNVPTSTQSSTPLTDSETSSGSAFWLHRIFRDDWGGATYRVARITFNGGESRVHSFLAVNTLNLSNRFTLTGFVGPQYSENQGLLVAGTSPNVWSLSGGAEGGWRDQRTNVFGGYSRSVSDGGGILGAVRLQNVYANLRRELVPGWAAAVTASHGSNHALLLLSPSSASSINLTSFGVSLERNVGKSVGLRMGYSHDLEQEAGLPAPSPTYDAHRNRFFVTLSYQWAKPLGL
ncbi:MAG: hypothetical protein WCA97_06625 [Terriglobales bacterium]|jgi:hypothetical protein